MTTWHCDINLEPGDVYVLVSHTGNDGLVSVDELRTQLEVLADEYALVLVPQTVSSWVSPGRVVGEYKRSLKMAAYARADAPPDLSETDAA